MSKIIMIHGAYGNPEENWFPWLKEELERLGHDVHVPKFPTPEGQTLESWRAVFEPYMDGIDEGTILVGHSLGPAFLLDVLERVERPVSAAFFVSGFIGLLGNPDFDSINKTFVDRGFDWKTIRGNCRKFFIFHSDDDPYVPLEKAKELAEKLGVEVEMVKGAGHFNEGSGYTRFGLLFQRIKEKYYHLPDSR